MQSDSGEGFSKGAGSQGSTGFTPRKSPNHALVDSFVGCLVGFFVLALLGLSSALLLGLCIRLVRWVGNF